MSLSVGDKLGPYEILAPIGAGGMGDVYKAPDTRLDRIVAVKVSKTEFSERFEREARAVASLNRSNICSLHDVGPNYLVIRLTSGEFLMLPKRRMIGLASAALWLVAIGTAFTIVSLALIGTSAARFALAGVSIAVIIFLAIGIGVLRAVLRSPNASARTADRKSVV